jgi:hypothetical protein
VYILKKIKKKKKIEKFWGATTPPPPPPPPKDGCGSAPARDLIYTKRCNLLKCFFFFKKKKKKKDHIPKPIKCGLISSYLEWNLHSEQKAVGRKLASLKCKQINKIIF